MPKTEFRIDILGASLLLSSDEDPVYMETLLTRYRRIVEDTQRSTGLTDPVKSAVLTGFLLCDEIERLRLNRMTDKAHIEAQQAEKIALELIEKIDKTIPEDFKK
ncbi:MAG: cell division protein ZapA [Spirochaetaceae bacterium]|jgi:hypothetical protein|nr:cell division protein ZapA [Spirochaetaceae bacterium]